MLAVQVTLDCHVTDQVAEQFVQHGTISRIIQIIFLFWLR